MRCWTCFGKVGAVAPDSSEEDHSVQIDGVLAATSVVPAAESRVDGQHVLPLQWHPILHKDRLWKEAAPVMVTTLVSSLIAFFSATFWFQLLSSFGESTFTPEGNHTVAVPQVCVNDSTSLPPKVFPVTAIRATVSVVKFLLIWLMLSVAAALVLLPTQPIGCIISSGLVLEVVIIGAVIILADLTPVTTIIWVDPCVSGAMILICFTAIAVSGSVGPASTRIIRSKAQALFFFCMTTVMLSFNTVVVNLLGVVDMHVVASVAISQVATRVFELMAKIMFKRCEDISMDAAMFVVFAYEAIIAYCIRRAFLAHAAATVDVVLGAALFGFIEVGFHVLNLLLAMWYHNVQVNRGRGHIAARHLTLTARSVESEIIAEHMALHASLATGLFLDHDILKLPINGSSLNIVTSWAWQFMFELMSSCIVLLFLLKILPVSLQDSRQLLAKVMISCLVAVYLIFPGMHNLVKVESLSCA